MPDVRDSIVEFLTARSIDFEQRHHTPTRTSEESAIARNEPLEHGGKAMLMKLDGRFALLVLSAACRVDSSSIRKQLNIRKARFATREELEQLTGLTPGAVPPFGHPILPLELYVDESILKNQKIAFNAGSLTDSIIMAVDDYLAVANAKILRFSQPSRDL